MCKIVSNITDQIVISTRMQFPNSSHGCSPCGMLFFGIITTYFP